MFLANGIEPRRSRGFTLVELLVVMPSSAFWSVCCCPQFNRLVRRHDG